MLLPLANSGSVGKNPLINLRDSLAIQQCAISGGFWQKKVEHSSTALH